MLKILATSVITSVLIVSGCLALKEPKTYEADFVRLAEMAVPALTCIATQPGTDKKKKKV